MALHRDSVNRISRTIKVPVSAGANISPGDTVVLSNVKERPLFHMEDDVTSPDCTIKDANAVSHPNGTAYGDAVFDPGSWKDGDPVFDPVSNL